MQGAQQDIQKMEYKAKLPSKIFKKLMENILRMMALMMDMMVLSREAEIVIKIVMQVGLLRLRETYLKIKQEQWKELQEQIKILSERKDDLGGHAMSAIRSMDQDKDQPDNHVLQYKMIVNSNEQFTNGVMDSMKGVIQIMESEVQKGTPCDIVLVVGWSWIFELKIFLNMSKPRKQAGTAEIMHATEQQMNKDLGCYKDLFDMVSEIIDKQE